MIIRVVNPSNALDETLRKRVRYGGRKGRRARLRLRRTTRFHTYSDILRMFIDGVEILGVTSIEYREHHR